MRDRLSFVGTRSREIDDEIETADLSTPTRNQEGRGRGRGRELRLTATENSLFRRLPHRSVLSSFGFSPLFLFFFPLLLTGFWWRAKSGLSVVDLCDCKYFLNLI